VGGKQSLNDAPPAPLMQTAMMEDDMPAAPPAVVPGTFKIMARKKEGRDDKSSNMGNDEDSGKKDFSKMALSEREQAYQEARARIFGESANAQQANPAAAEVSEETIASKPTRRHQQDRLKQKQTEEELKQAALEAKLEQKAKAARRARGTSQFHVGVFVVAAGLKEAAHLNGKAGVIQSCDKDKGQCLVNFEGGHGQKLLTLDNLDLPWSLE